GLPAAPELYALGYREHDPLLPRHRRGIAAGQRLPAGAGAGYPAASQLCRPDRPPVVGGWRTAADQYPVSVFQGIEKRRTGRPGPVRVISRERRSAPPSRAPATGRLATDGSPGKPCDPV